MVTGNSRLTAEIRQWLTEHPVTEDQSLDIHGVPPELFELTNNDERLRQLNLQIKKLPLQQQKLLLYLSRDMDPALIIESMEYLSPELFWLDKAKLIKEIDPAARQQDVLRVFAANESLLAEIYAVSDLMDIEAEKSKSKKTRNRMLLVASVILILTAIFIYPLVIKPDPVAWYEKYKTSFRPDMAAIDTSSYAGGAYFEALLLMEEGNFSESARLFEEMIPSDSTFRTSSRWFLALINLRNGEKESCLEQLRAIRNDDPAFYKRVAEKLFQKLDNLSTHLGIER